MGIQKIGTIIIAQILETIIQILVTLYLYYMKFLTDINSICFSLIIGLLISDACSFIYLIYAYKHSISDMYNKRSSQCSYISFAKKIRRISLPVAITTYIKTGLSALKNSMIPIAFVAYGLTYNDALTYYGLISSTVMSLILFPFTFIQAYSSMLIPEITSIKSEVKIKKIIKQSLYATFYFSLIIVIILIVFSDFINAQFYKNLSISIYIKILSPIIVYIYLDNVIDSILKSLDLQTYVMIINVIDLIVSILFIKFLIPIYGIKGYIFILYFSEIFNFSLSLYTLKKK